MKGRHRIVVFDVGGVLCDDAVRPKMADIARRHGRSVSDVRDAAEGLRSAVDEGRTSEAGFWSRILATCGVDPAPGDLSVAEYVKILPGVPELLEDTRSAGYVPACLTNDSLELAELRQRALAAATEAPPAGAPPAAVHGGTPAEPPNAAPDWASLSSTDLAFVAPVFQTVLVSAEVGVQKPDPAIYRLLLDRLRVAPAECLFFDDSHKNVEAARAMGMDAEVFVGVAEVRRILSLDS